MEKGCSFNDSWLKLKKEYYQMNIRKNVVNFYKNTQEFAKLTKVLKPLFRKNKALQSVQFIPKDPTRIIKVGLKAGWWSSSSVFLTSDKCSFLTNIHKDLEKYVLPLASSRGRYIMVKRSDVM